MASGLFFKLTKIRVFHRFCNRNGCFVGFRPQNACAQAIRGADFDKSTARGSFGRRRRRWSGTARCVAKEHRSSLPQLHQPWLLWLQARVPAPLVLRVRKANKIQINSEFECGLTALELALKRD